MPAFTLALSSGDTLACRAVLFDLDGVLVDSMPTIVRHLRDWAVAHGLDADRVVELSHGRSNVDLIRVVAPFLPVEREARRMERREVDDVAGIVARPGGARLLDALPRRAVVTSGNTAVARARLLAAGLPVPDVLVTADDVRVGKPDPEGYLTAAALVGVSPAECVVFEDAPAGVAAARAAGMRVVGVAGTVDPAELGADHHVADLDDVRLCPADAHRRSTA
ncbi:HAD-IA family hydrolase [Actinosynnema sp. NPDC020468]|uniref:HAD-IA family hydrolase n=1 Tax=Actinosynnema sp. NPDC020468 TaxID=3154488 RepID=UPI0033EF1224